MECKEPKFNTITGSCWKKSLTESRERRKRNKSKITDIIKMNNKPVSQEDDCNVICPYCLHEYQAECEDYSEFERREECENCGKEYTLYQTFTVTHHTEPVTKD